MNWLKPVIAIQWRKPLIMEMAMFSRFQTLLGWTANKRDCRNRGLMENGKETSWIDSHVFPWVIWGKETLPLDNKSGRMAAILFSYSFFVFFFSLFLISQRLTTHIRKAQSQSVSDALDSTQTKLKVISSTFLFVCFWYLLLLPFLLPSPPLQLILVSPS